MNSLSGKEDVFDFVSFNYSYANNNLQDFVDATKTQWTFVGVLGSFWIQLIILNFITTIFFHFLLHQYRLNSIKLLHRYPTNAICIKYDVWSFKLIVSHQGTKIIQFFIPIRCKIIAKIEKISSKVYPFWTHFYCVLLNNLLNNLWWTKNPQQIIFCIVYKYVCLKIKHDNPTSCHQLVIRIFTDILEIEQEPFQMTHFDIHDLWDNLDICFWRIIGNAAHYHMVCLVYIHFSIVFSYDSKFTWPLWEFCIYYLD